MSFVIRPAVPADGPRLQTIERAAGERFRDAGMPEIADDEPPSEEVLARYAHEGLSWVVVDGAGEAIGYVLVEVLDGNAHVEQVSVHPDAQGRGAGRALLEHVRSWAGRVGLGGVTLTTFVDIGWNAPLYQHLGFRILAEHETGPELRAAQAAEAARGLDPSTRCCMGWDLR